MTSRLRFSRTMLCALLSLDGTAATSLAETVRVQYPQGFAHGFVEITTQDGKRIGIGDLEQKLRDRVVTSHLTLHFFDGSLDDETTVYSERGVFRLLSDRHVQTGPSFPTPSTTLVDAQTGNITVTAADGSVTRAHIDIPADVYNGMASTILMNLAPAKTQAVISIVIPLAKPRLAHLTLKRTGEVSYTMGGEVRNATEYVVHVELGGIAGVVAPLIGKEPADYHVLIAGGEVPAFLREEGPLYVGGPLWRIQQISASFAK